MISQETVDVFVKYFGEVAGDRFGVSGLVVGSDSVIISWYRLGVLLGQFVFEGSMYYLRVTERQPQLGMRVECVGDIGDPTFDFEQLCRKVVVDFDVSEARRGVRAAPAPGV